jgi:hypothetical protein
VRSGGQCSFDGHGGSVAWGKKVEGGGAVQECPHGGKKGKAVSWPGAIGPLRAALSEAGWRTREGEGG